MTITFKNYTPHTVSVLNEKNEIILSVESEGKAIRVNEEITETSTIAGFPVVSKKYTDCSGLPEQKEGVILIVSVLVLQACPDRTDLVCPDTSPDSAVRNEKGQIVGVRRFQANEKAVLVNKKTKCNCLFLKENAEKISYYHFDKFINWDIGGAHCKQHCASCGRDFTEEIEKLTEPANKVGFDNITLKSDNTFIF